MFLNVNEYKHLACVSDMINAAIQDARTSGKIVVIPPINERTGKDVWEITKSIVLYSGTTLVLNNSHLRMGDGIICRMMVNANYNLPVTEENLQKNITVRGIGGAMLDGGIHNGIYEKNGIARKVPQKTDKLAVDNCTMYFKNVENLVVEGIHIKNHRYWGCLLTSASYSRVSNLRFTSESNVPNQDGVDVCAGCHDVIVENITGCTGDNLVAICALGVKERPGMGDIHNITVRNVMGYGVNGCALVRLLNHDGNKLYNIRIDNIIETSPWSEKDAPVAQNPDLLIRTDDEGNIIPWKKIIPGEIGYRIEATVLIGESYWFSKSKAQPGDTFGISVSNVMSHSRFAVWINNTLQDSSFDNIRLFGNGFMAVFFGEGEMENLRFTNLSYDKDCKPVAGDERIRIEWNHTESDGLSAIYCNGTKLKNVVFDRVDCNDALDSVFGGHGSGEVVLDRVKFAKDSLSTAQGICVR